ncbi:DUF2683 family protein [Candidatus Woesearchaeota archaeon]|nr:MAG: hypothetical protein QS99_C0008G0039 [archaeon GW2011_AR4]MBS3129683.1 DUF2683 family protein [Candidatus Woesearchaeota archaeon]HIH38787.1 DUF2683 family protein [Candidatus Woesearchaeota archaeon]HIH49203.1 DUF2683 family protein [Candidatus Woesearchaeota archaeon]HIJ03345.1 DUF2683 family protein [Candidatus Woesearchaeota archaeon]
MVQAIITLDDHQDRVLNIIKGKYGLKNKSDAVNFVISKFEDDLLEPELRPEYIDKIRLIEKKGKFHAYKDISSLRKEIEHA